jgi:hypothetical protein
MIRDQPAAPGRAVSVEYFADAANFEVVHMAKKKPEPSFSMAWMASRRRCAGMFIGEAVGP